MMKGTLYVMRYVSYIMYVVCRAERSEISNAGSYRGHMTGKYSVIEARVNSICQETIRKSVYPFQNLSRE